MNYRLMLEPGNALDLNCYDDADFTGLWPHEDKLDPTTIKSLTGFAICLNLVNCPIVWTSKFQQYNVLSHSMKMVLPLRELLTIIAQGIGLEDNYATTFKTTVWEENAGDLTLVNMEPVQITL